jgi:outer membrane biosynthesis protein TonB
MQDSEDLAVDPSSPDAPVEDSFFKQGIDPEVHARYEAHAPQDDWSKRARRLRIAASSAIATVGVVAIGLLIWGGPSSPGPASVAVLSPAAAAPPPPAPPPPTPPPVAPVPAPTAAIAQPAAVSVPAAAPAAEPAPEPVADSAPLEQSCRDAAARKRPKEVLDSCGRAFEARPAAADLAVLVAESELDRGRLASALTWARKAVAVDPTIADAYVFIGTAEQQAGHGVAARTAYQRYLELAPAGRFSQDLKAILASLK